MKTLILSISKIKAGTIKDTFIVLAVLSAIVLTVVILDYYNLIKEYQW